ncbi:SDR family oxidoreductase [Nocardia sp. NPDC049707]|uniref:SDR family NAD(P)-dependent oxidoreductase n=1 Tax=Nocardia sp. NPDC049707 TaxID=3154735 RepID=UPI00341C74F7
MNLHDDVALVTGAGRGVGRAVALELASLGAHLVVNDLDPQPLAETVSAVREAGGRAVALPGDITRADFAPAFIGLGMSTFGRIDIVVNNAGWADAAAAHKLTDEQWNQMIAVHLLAPFQILRAAHRVFVDQAKADDAEGAPRHRKVVNVTSVAGVYGASGVAHYAAAKAGLVGLTKTLAKEWGRYRVNVNAVALGTIDTRLTRPPSAKDALTTTSGRVVAIGTAAAVRERLINESPLRRPGRPDEAARAISMLCTAAADYVTGHVLHCDGGATATV